jgi:hypothetical protein
MRVTRPLFAAVAAALLHPLGMASAAHAQDSLLGWAQPLAAQQVPISAAWARRAMPAMIDRLQVHVSLDVLAGCAVTSAPQLRISCGLPYLPFAARVSPLRSADGETPSDLVAIHLEF